MPTEQYRSAHGTPVSVWERRLVPVFIAPVVAPTGDHRAAIRNREPERHSPFRPCSCGKRAATRQNHIALIWLCAAENSIFPATRQKGFEPLTFGSVDRSGGADLAL
jgi:hypothetical protein